MLLFENWSQCRWRILALSLPMLSSFLAMHSNAKLSRHRANRLASTTGLGTHLVSPEKRVAKRKLRDKTVPFLDLQRKRLRYEKELEDLLSPGAPLPSNAESNVIVPEESKGLDQPSGFEGFDDQWEDVDPTNEPSPVPDALTETKSSPKKKHLTPDQATINLYAKWRILLPKLVDALLAYTANTIGKILQPVTSGLKGQCNRGGASCETRESSILCLYFDHFATVKVRNCVCQTLSQTLVRHGLFPTAPEQIRMAVSIDFLDFYSALFERSCNAVNAMANALNSFYNRRGFYLLNGKGERYREPFRRGLGYATQWLDGLRVMIEKSVDSVLEQADTFLQSSESSPAANETQSFRPNVSSTSLQPPNSVPPSLHLPLFISHPPSPPTARLPPSQSNAIIDEVPKVPRRSECARVLRQLCPACFGGLKFGRPLADGGDFHIATDGNFHHRHLASGGKSIPSHEPKHIIPKSFVDEVGEAIAQARRSSPKNRKPKVPDAAVDECEKSHDAADGDKKKAVTGEG